MSDRINTLIELARKLTPEERALFLDRLHDLVSPPDPAWASAWVSECEDRLTAVERGEMQAENFDDAIQRLRTKYAAQ
ncbi:MAG: hypothetical protein QG595_372 [Pseudomonadota bacterium]|nr:hypothetical protein [Pseudomonadota bacterium]